MSLPRLDVVSDLPQRAAVTTLRLTDFRNYARLALDLDARHVVLAGDNGAGKTNLIEAVSLLAPGRGLRRATLGEMARLAGDGSFAVAAVIGSPDGETRIGTGLALGTDPDDDRARVIRIDGVPARRAEDMVEHIRVLWLTPAMDGLFTGPAAERRRFLDRLVGTIDPDHGARVNAFEKAMRGRNRLLEDARPDRTWLDAIEAQMAEMAVAIAAGRVETVGCLAGLIAEARDDASPFPHAELALAGQIEADLSHGAGAGSAEDGYRRILHDARPRDAAAGRTLDGPHRSDLAVSHGPKAMPAAQSSTGEQKSLLLGLVLAHARLVGRLTGQAPVLLLDEVAAHLDHRRRAGLFDALDHLGGQCWMTGTDAEAFVALGPRALVVEVRDGTVRPRG